MPHLVSAAAMQRTLAANLEGTKTGEDKALVSEVKNK